MLFGLLLNGLVTAANAGTMPVVGIPPTVHPASTMWRAATTTTRLAFLADQSRLGLFSIGDLMMIFGGILIIAICALRTLDIKIRGKSQSQEKRLGQWGITPAIFRPNYTTRNGPKFNRESGSSESAVPLWDVNRHGASFLVARRRWDVTF